MFCCVRLTLLREQMIGAGATRPGERSSFSELRSLQTLIEAASNQQRVVQDPAVFEHW
jgi:hypothetical protein